MVKRGGEFIAKRRVEDLPHRPNENRNPRIAWVDEHIEAVHMESIHIPGTLRPRYCITIDLTTKQYDPVLGYVEEE